MDNFLMNPQKQTITSLELLEQINFFRWKEGNRAELQHKTLLAIIRDEFSEEIAEQKILLSEYKDSTGKKNPMYILTLAQGRQVLMRESKFVRKGVIEYIDKLEKNIKYLETERLGILERENKLLLRENKVLIKENELLKKSENTLQPLEQPRKLKKAIATKRGFIFKITRLEPGYTETDTGYADLYRAFESKYNLNLTDEMIKNGKTSIRKVDYIEKNLKMIDELLKIAIEIFPTGYKKAKEKYKEDIKKLKI